MLSLFEEMANAAQMTMSYEKEMRMTDEGFEVPFLMKEEVNVLKV